MTNRLALPMYAIHPPATRALMQAIKTLLARHGIEAQPVWPDDLQAHWQDAHLLLSQTCGYPLVTRLTAVQPVGTFHYRAPGCSGRDYRSWLVARDKQATLADFTDQRAVANSLDSHSGYNALRFVAARQGVTFSQLILSGGIAGRWLRCSKAMPILLRSTASAGRCWRVMNRKHWMACI